LRKCREKPEEDLEYEIMRKVAKKMVESKTGITG
jgi:hypothetical protein